MMWNGSFSDSEVVTPQFLLAQAAKYLQPGRDQPRPRQPPGRAQLLRPTGHADPQPQPHPVTLDEMFGTSRATG